MSSPVNPILVVKNNLPDYKQELMARREKLITHVGEIDEELKVLHRLQDALEPAVVYIAKESTLEPGWDRGPGA